MGPHQDFLHVPSPLVGSSGIRAVVSMWGWAPLFPIPVALGYSPHMALLHLRTRSGFGASTYLLVEVQGFLIPEPIANYLLEAKASHLGEPNEAVSRATSSPSWLGACSRRGLGKQWPR